MTTETLHTIEEDIKVVTDAFLNGRPVPPEVDARLDEHAAEFRKRIFEKNGLLDIAVLTEDVKLINAAPGFSTLTLDSL